MLLSSTSSSSSSIIALVSKRRRLLQTSCFNHHQNNITTNSSIRRYFFRGGTNNINISSEPPITSNDAYNKIGGAITATAAVIVLSLTSSFLYNSFPTTKQPADTDITTCLDAILPPPSSLIFNKDTTTTTLSADDTDKGKKEETSRRCHLSWVTESNKTTIVDCHRLSKQQMNSNNHKKQIKAKELLLFDPLESDYFQIKLSNDIKIADDDGSLSNNNKSGSSCIIDDVVVETIEAETNDNGNDDANTTNDNTEVIEMPTTKSSSFNSSILHNTVIVLPNLMTEKECQSIVNETERIRLENKTKGGCKTEKWTLYSRYNHPTQQIIDRVLVDQVLMFIRQRMPNIAKQLLLIQQRSAMDDTNNTNSNETTTSSNSNDDDDSNKKHVMRYYWDDPVVVTYSPGNKLAPHNDLRDLTIVIPLKYPSPSSLLIPPLPPPSQQINNKDIMIPSSSSELEGRTNGPNNNNGTKFWIEGTSPEDAMEKIHHVSSDGSYSGDDDDGGIEITPSLGSGILFNGEITHTGSAIAEGTRYVLMTSITLDEEEDYDDYEDDDDDDINEDDDDDDDVNEDDE